jgi:hypothetical protein
MKSEPTWPKTLPRNPAALRTKSTVHESLRDISYSNYNPRWLVTLFSKNLRYTKPGYLWPPCPYLLLLSRTHSTHIDVSTVSEPSRKLHLMAFVTAVTQIVPAHYLTYFESLLNLTSQWGLDPTPQLQLLDTPYFLYLAFFLNSFSHSWMYCVIYLLCLLSVSLHWHC